MNVIWAACVALVTILPAEERAGPFRFSEDQAKNVDRYVPDLSDPDHKVRENAVEHVIEEGDTAGIPYLIKALQDPNEGVRMHVAERLGLKSYPAQQVIPLLCTALKDEYCDVRALAAMSLEAYGPEAKAAVPNLLHSLKDDQYEVRATAAGALGEIGDSAAIPLLIQELQDQHQLVRWVSALRRSASLPREPGWPSPPYCGL